MEQLMKELIERIDALERRMEKIEEKIFPLWKIDDEVNDNLVPLCRQSALTLALERLMDYKDRNGRYLMRRRYQWWAAI